MSRLVAAMTRTLKGNLAVVADPAHGPLLQHPQELGLQARRHVADLVEEQGAAVGGQHQTLAIGPGVGEGAAHVAEKLALEQRLRHGGAVDRHERPVGPRAATVQRASNQLLAGAALAGDEAGGLGAGRPPSRSNRSRIGALAPTISSKADRPRPLALEALELAAQPLVLDGALDPGHEVGRLERLGQEVVGANPERGDGGVEAAVGGDHHHRQVRPVGDDPLAQLDARQAVLELDVGHHHVEVLFRQQGERLLGRVAGRHLEAAVPQVIVDRGAEVVVVVDQQDAAGSGSRCRGTGPSGVARRTRPARQLDREGGTLARLAPDVDVAAVRLRNVTADEEAQAEAARRLAPAAPLEAAEQARHVLLRNALAAVGHREPDEAVVLEHVDSRSACRPRA
jgi:hypothetical protein